MGEEGAAHHQGIGEVNMSNNIEILVPDDAASDALHSVLGTARSVRLVKRWSQTSVPRMMMGLLSSFESVDGRARLKAFIHAARRHTRDAPAIFLSFDMKRHALASSMAAQTFAMFVAKLRSRFDPYVAPDAASIRRLIHARRIDATDQLIASASTENGTLIVWSCEPKRYEIPISEIPALGPLRAEALKKLEVSSSGSRIHWEDGDVDINLDTIRAIVDPVVRQAHEAEARQEAAEYSSAIRQLRLEKGLKQSDFEGLTARQVRRLEAGDTVPHIGTLRKLAAAHQMAVQDYLNELAERSPSKRRRSPKT
jgi:hypothetical protein